MTIFDQECTAQLVLAEYMESHKHDDQAKLLLDECKNGRITFMEVCEKLNLDGKKLPDRMEVDEKVNSEKKPFVLVSNPSQLLLKKRMAAKNQPRQAVTVVTSNLSNNSESTRNEQENLPESVGQNESPAFLEVVLKQTASICKEFDEIYHERIMVILRVLAKLSDPTRVYSAQSSDFFNATTPPWNDLSVQEKAIQACEQVVRTKKLEWLGNNQPNDEPESSHKIDVSKANLSPFLGSKKVTYASSNMEHGEYENSEASVALDYSSPIDKSTSLATVHPNLEQRDSGNDKFASFQSESDTQSNKHISMNSEISETNSENLCSQGYISNSNHSPDLSEIATSTNQEKASSFYSTVSELLLSKTVDATRENSNLDDFAAGNDYIQLSPLDSDVALIDVVNLSTVPKKDKKNAKPSQPIAREDVSNESKKITRDKFASGVEFIQLESESDEDIREIREDADKKSTNIPLILPQLGQKRKRSSTPEPAEVILPKNSETPPVQGKLKLSSAENMVHMIKLLNQKHLSELNSQAQESVQSVGHDNLELSNSGQSNQISSKNDINIDQDTTEGDSKVDPIDFSNLTDNDPRAPFQTQLHLEQGRILQLEKEIANASNTFQRYHTSMRFRHKPTVATFSSVNAGDATKKSRKEKKLLKKARAQMRKLENARKSTYELPGGKKVATRVEVQNSLPDSNYF
jgi:hypothetical protein